MKLAVVIPSYNHSKYIRVALESILNQTRRPDRIIVIDDGSQDNSAEIIREYSAEGVELTVQENAGAHNTINRAVEQAAEDCDLIAILNSDDHYHLDRFEKCLPIFEKDPSTKVVCSRLDIIGSDGESLPVTESRWKWFRAAWSIGGREDVEICEWLGMANFPATTSNIVARSDFLREHPFRPYRFNHDYFFLASAALLGHLRIVDEPLVHYRVHEKNTMNVEPAPLLKEMLRMNLDLYRWLAPRLNSDSAVRQRFYDYLRGSSMSISSFHSGLMQVVLADIARKHGTDEFVRILDALEENQFEELATYPNKALVNTHDGSAPLGSGSGLAEKYELLRKESQDLKQQLASAKELAKLRQTLLVSKSAALKRLLGFFKPTDNGKLPQEKLENLRNQIGSPISTIDR